MPIELRPIAPEEYLDLAHATMLGFGEQATTEEEIKELEDERIIFEFDRSLAAFDDGKIVGTGEIYSFQLTLPGLTTVPAAGVTWITVSPTHRRRGILTAMMRRQLEDIRARGEPVAILYASESVIYGRFGYGCASDILHAEIEPHFSAFGRSPEVTGAVRFIDRKEALELLPPLYERIRCRQPGAITRRPEWWELYTALPERHRDGASATFFAVYESGRSTGAGALEGYVAYRINSKWEHGLPENTLRIRKLETYTSEARAGLWRFCLDVDLVKTVEAFVPVDEPLRWMLADPRRFRAIDHDDSLWVRVIDIPAALSARRYQAAGELVFAISDPFLPENDGRYHLEGGPDGAHCVRADADADLSLQITDLGAIYLGGVTAGTLARAGRITELRAGALCRADAMFASDPAPYCATGF